jgi:transcription elongation factor GreB
MADKNYITPSGYKRLIDELTSLATVERPKVCREVSDAAAEGDRSENAAYIYGKRRLREIDRRMVFIKKRMKTMNVVRPDAQQRDKVFFGAYVECEDDDSGDALKFQIVGVDEVDATAGRISWQSPIGRALLGKKVDDSATVVLPNGRRSLTVNAIRYDAEPERVNVPQSRRAAKPQRARPPRRR